MFIYWWDWWQTINNRILSSVTFVFFLFSYSWGTVVKTSVATRGTGARACSHLGPLMKIQCEDGGGVGRLLSFCWLVAVSPACSSWAWLMELSAMPQRGREQGCFPIDWGPVYLPSTDGPPGAPARLHLPCLPCSVSSIFISSQVPEHSGLAHRSPLPLVHLPKVARCTQIDGSLRYYYNQVNMVT